ncbi:cytochrome c oxidase assembly protein COX18, mitochondrial-like [Saccoglossus kowalevskii]
MIGVMFANLVSSRVSVLRTRKHLLKFTAERINSCRSLTFCANSSTRLCAIKVKPSWCKVNSCLPCSATLPYAFEQRRYESGLPDSSQMIYVPTVDEIMYEWIEYIHNATHFPWWLAIIASTIAMRTVLHLPLGIMMQRILARMEITQPKINGQVEIVKQQLEIMAKNEGWQESYKAERYQNEVKDIVRHYHKSEKCNPWRSLIPVSVHVITWMEMTQALGQMSGGSPTVFGTQMDVDFIPEFLNQGALWFSNMTVPDPYLILPTMLCISNLALIEMWNLRRGPETKTQQRVKFILRGVSISMLPLASILPASIQLYWLTSSLCGIAQFFLLQSRKVRRLVDIPKSPSEMTHPLKEMKQTFKIRYSTKKWF